MWLPVDDSDAPKISSRKGKRLIVFHAGNREEDLIDRCDLVFLAKAKDGDYLKTERSFLNLIFS
jgi:hypothetical protein